MKYFDPESHLYPFFCQGFNKIGWYSGLRAKYPNAMADEVLSGNTTCGIPRHDSFQLLRDPVDSDLPWPGFLFGQSTASIWYWCADQVIKITCNLSHRNFINSSVSFPRNPLGQS